MTAQKKKLIQLNPPLPEEQVAAITRATLKAGGYVAPDFESGQMVTGQGIYLGRYSPQDRKGNSLGKVFNVFAAPQDLRETMTYADTVEHIAGLKNWHGHNGTNYATDWEIYAALKDGSYTGGWIIPPRELLVGTKPDSEKGVRESKVIQPDNLFDHKNKGAFKGTFRLAAYVHSDYPDRYWSSTEHRDDPYVMCIVQLSSSNAAWYRKEILRLSCRPVRLVECKAF